MLWITRITKGIDKIQVKGHRVCFQHQPSIYFASFSFLIWKIGLTLSSHSHHSWLLHRIPNNRPGLGQELKCEYSFLQKKKIYFSHFPEKEGGDLTYLRKNSSSKGSHHFNVLRSHFNACRKKKKSPHSEGERKVKRSTVYIQKKKNFSSSTIL